MFKCGSREVPVTKVEEHCVLQIHSHYDNFKQAAASSKATRCEAAKKVKAAKIYPPQPLRRSRRPAAIVAAYSLSIQPAGTPERKSPGSSDKAYEPDSGATGVFCCTSTVCPATPSSPTLQRTSFSWHTGSLTFALRCRLIFSFVLRQLQGGKGLQPEQPRGLKEAHLTTSSP